MNAIVNSVSVLEGADPAQKLMLIPLSRLRPSRRNVRKTAAASSAELAASILRVGLLQNLTVIEAADGEHYEVVAGDRRRTALKLLAKQRRIPKDYEVPCLLVPEASARTASLTENVQREAMHPADQFEAFAALVAEGRSIEEIAADFSVTPLVVQRRLKLANVSPRLMADYRAGAVALDHLMALAITDDHSAQEAAFYDAPEWQRSPSALRGRLTEREIDAQQPLARFVGLDAYTAAGGGTRRDLFAEDDTGVYLNDAALLERLAREKLAVLAEQARTEGWAWVEAVPHLSYVDKQAFQNAPRQRREPTTRERRRMATLQARIEKADAALETAYDNDDEAKVEALQEQLARVVAELDAVQETLQEYAPDVRAVAGAIITIGQDGEAVTHRGLMRDAEAKALRTLERLRNGSTDDVSAEREEGSDTDAKQAKSAGLSDRLAQRLSAHRTAALQIELAQHPQAALAALVRGMVRQALRHGYAAGLPIGIRLTMQNRLEGYAADWPESRAAVALRELQAAWSERLPEDDDALFAGLLALPQDELVRLLAVCVASTVDVVTPRAADVAPGADLARAVQLDMRTWWTPTAEGYFAHVTKATILEAVQQFAPAEVARLSKLNKADIVGEAERLVEGTGWMPSVFKLDEGGSAPLVEAQAETQHDTSVHAVAACDGAADPGETLAA